ncbi:MAPEG family protein [Alkalimonas mucilaginosa]|uniref:MAPEG family protein n=1 Tax=Alkalimonas mucilaginosa TaxID=3057676 RepID=A0ABU7JHG0_9GAMM|nr:MAPEG family protein [Alkalimonas sp. MEB004]MEE2024861.1 MAPEG family protein [Alkalimonas sp. MEB004]
MITPFYAALLVLLFIVLAIRVIRLRRRFQVALGDGKHSELSRAIRVHANFVEYVPLTLLLLFFIEQQGSAAWLVHGLGITLLAARVSHAWGVSQLKEQLNFRVTGMLLTFAVLLLSASLLLWQFVGF